MDRRIPVEVSGQEREFRKELFGICGSVRRAVIVVVKSLRVAQTLIESITKKKTLNYLEDNFKDYLNLRKELKETFYIYIYGSIREVIRAKIAMSETAQKHGCDYVIP